MGSTPKAFHLPVLSPRRKSIQSALAVLVLFGLTVAGIVVGQQSFGRVQDALERDRAAEAEAPVPALQSTAEAVETGRQFVRQHGGSIAAASDPGVYTEMVLTIPVKCELCAIAEARAS